MLTVFLIYRLFSGSVIETNILALLPNIEIDPAVERAIQSVETTLGKKTIFVVGSKNQDQSIVAAQKLHNELNQSDLFSDITFRFNQSKQRDFLEFYSPHRSALISKSTSQLLEENNFQAIQAFLHQSLYNPIGTAFPDLLAKDPLFFFLNYIRSLPRNESELNLVNGYLMTKKNGQHYVFFYGMLKEKALSISVQESFEKAYQTALENVYHQYPKAEILSSGMIHHAVHGMKSMKKDITLISIGSMIGIFILIFFTFKTLNPLFLCLIPILTGFAMALSVTLLFFEKVHLLTLVFGSSLIGISIDYSFHYLSEQYHGGMHWQAGRGLKHIFPGITLGLLTSVIGFSALAIAPFPGLRQMALFSVAGITTAYLVVVLIFPFLLKAKNSNPIGWIKKLSNGIINFWDEKMTYRRFILSLICSLMFIGWGLSQINFSDDIRLLQSRSQLLLSQENQLRKIIGLKQSLPIYIVKAESPQELLEKEEILSKQLDTAILSNRLSGYLAISSFIPSKKTQVENYLLQKRMLSTNKPLHNLLQNVGYQDEVIQNYQYLFKAAEPNYLTIKKWQESSQSEFLNFLWLGPIDREYVSIISLGEISDYDSLMAIGDTVEGVSFVDHVTEISNLLHRYRLFSGKLVVVGYLVIFGTLLIRYGLKKSCLIIIPPVFAALIAISIIALLGNTLNFFNTIALFLVLGIGIDYTLFFAENPENRGPTMVAIILSGMTTLLSFGLLALSQTAFIHSFGIMILVGISIVFLSAPIVGAKLKR